MNLAVTLRELHRLHGLLANVRERIARGPKQIQAGEGSCKKFELDLAKAKETYKQGKLASDEKQLQLKSREAKILDLRGKLNQAESNQVYQTLKDQIAADQQANSVMADEILETLEKLDLYQAQITEANNNLAKAKEELEKTRKRVADQQQQLEAELSHILVALQKVEEELPEDFRIDFQRISKAKGEDALAPLEGESCGGCYQMLSPQTINQLRLGRPLFCTSCGRLLYLAEDVDR
jgi:predicted  nucleic acid-binding Zn-ribbon protein